MPRYTQLMVDTVGKAVESGNASLHRSSVNGRRSGFAMFPKPDEWFKKAFEQWEEQTADWWTARLRDPDFLKSIWQTVEVTLQSQRMANEMAQQTLAAWQLPTRANHERILHQINRLQIMVDDLEERLDALLKEIGD